MTQNTESKTYTDNLQSDKLHGHRDIESIAAAFDKLHGYCEIEAGLNELGTAPTEFSESPTRWSYMVCLPWEAGTPRRARGDESCPQPPFLPPWSLGRSFPGVLGSILEES